MQIIIVDDEPVSLLTLKQLVEKMPGCDVRGFTQARPALDWCQHNRPDLVIVGYVMPELNGLEFTAQFRKLEGRSETPVLMVTASVDRDVRNRAFEIGVNDFMNKPYDSVELQTRVSNMLALSSKGQRSSARSAPRADEVSRKDGDADHAQGTDHLLDLDMTLKRLAGDEILLGQVARVFIRTAPQLLSAIRSALEANDSERAYAEAHSLKGAVAVFEAPHVLEAVTAVEKHAINYDAAAAKSALTKAQKQVERLASELTHLIPAQGKAA